MKKTVAVLAVLIILAIILTTVLVECNGGDEGTYETYLIDRIIREQSTVSAVTNSYDDPRILDYYELVNQAYVDAGWDITRLSLEIGSCALLLAPNPVLGALSCTSAAYDTVMTIIRTVETWNAIAALHDEIRDNQMRNKFPVFMLLPNSYPHVPDEFRTFYSWNDFRQQSATAVLEHIIGSGTQINDLIAAPFGEFARLTIEFRDGKMETVIINANPIFFISTPEDTVRNCLKAIESRDFNIVPTYWVEGMWSEQDITEAQAAWDVPDTIDISNIVVVTISLEGNNAIVKFEFDLEVTTSGKTTVEHNSKTTPMVRVGDKWLFTEDWSSY